MPPLFLSLGHAHLSSCSGPCPAHRLPLQQVIGWGRGKKMPPHLHHHQGVGEISQPAPGASWVTAKDLLPLRFYDAIHKSSRVRQAHRKLGLHLSPPASQSIKELGSFWKFACTAGRTWNISQGLCWAMVEKVAASSSRSSLLSPSTPLASLHSEFLVEVVLESQFFP